LNKVNESVTFRLSISVGSTRLGVGVGVGVNPQWEVNPEFTEVKFSEGGPKGWFAVVRRQG
jgi:hypothetical protein